MSVDYESDNESSSASSTEEEVERLKAKLAQLEQETRVQLEAGKATAKMALSFSDDSSVSSDDNLEDLKISEERSSPFVSLGSDPAAKPPANRASNPSETAPKHNWSSKLSISSDEDSNDYKNPSKNTSSFFPCSEHAAKPSNRGSWARSDLASNKASPYSKEQELSSSNGEDSTESDVLHRKPTPKSSGLEPASSSNPREWRPNNLDAKKKSAAPKARPKDSTARHYFRRIFHHQQTISQKLSKRTRICRA
eukprot:CAMPEP_0176008364 /NCGR_PEP_ID=MMETSP0120_2-20121206/3708_1 /TAXON_ID=160619 /ORGANISM="Kryptoperidinium foliaceum, Strain CCMP 1326" /LENGTH=251 /DNA_ID=CAMNT_0017341149 /DNA_START=56 /DNA_END=807 /DNA_ORIENTATION=-